MLGEALAYLGNAVTVDGTPLSWMVPAQDVQFWDMHKPTDYEFYKMLELKYVNDVVLSAAQTQNMQPTKIMARKDIVYHHNLMRNLSLAVQ